MKKWHFFLETIALFVIISCDEKVSSPYYEEKDSSFHSGDTPITQIEPPLISFSHNAIEFGYNLTQNQKIVSVEISNTGEYPLKIKSVRLIGNEHCVYSLLGPDRITITREQKSNMSIVFASNSPGFYNSTLLVESNDALKPVVKIPICGMAKSSITADNESSHSPSCEAPSCEVLLENSSLCADDDGSHDINFLTCDNTAPTVDISGKWKSEFVLYEEGKQADPSIALFSLEQKEDRFTGTFLLDTVVEGHFDGVVSGNLACGVGFNTTDWCPGAFEFTATIIDNSKVEVNIIGKVCGFGLDGTVKWIGERY